MALAECKRLLGDERFATVLKGLRRNVRRTRRQRETVVLWESLRALTRNLRALKQAVEHSWALKREETAARAPETVRETIVDSIAELKAFPVRPSEVHAFFERLKLWLHEGQDLMAEAERIRPRVEVAETDEPETRAIANFLVTFAEQGERSISPHIAALLEVANGLELPRKKDARDEAWEKLRDKWKKALRRARASASPRRAPTRRRQSAR
ncbi:hypothetical protein [Hyalangium versicolor]|uniref:hypothetical protein n=1 Tax=Hyalangium versicolor TaxID=2861190 RepID=UPI001CCA0409|nr:hypothetical protein [Hyalangium versicolor]